MKKVVVIVKLKETVLDPQGETVKRAAEHLGYTGIDSVRIGKYIELKVDESVSKETIEELSERLFANPVIESFEVIMEE